MNESSNPKLPSGLLTKGADGNEFIGIAVLALPTAMTIFGCQLLRLAVARELNCASIEFEHGWKYDQHRAVAIFHVKDWRAAANCVRNTLESLEILGVSAIYRYDFSESIWRRIHSGWAGDFKAILDSVSPEFSAAELEKLAALQQCLKDFLTPHPENPTPEL